MSIDQSLTISNNPNDDSEEYLADQVVLACVSYVRIAQLYSASQQNKSPSFLNGKASAIVIQLSIDASYTNCETIINAGSADNFFRESYQNGQNQNNQQSNLK